MTPTRIELLIVIVDLAAGTGTFTRTLAGGLRGLYPEEFEVSLLTLRPQILGDADRTLFDRVHTLDTPVHNDWRKAYELPLAIRKLRRFLANNRPDVIFAVHTFSNVVASSAAGDIPVILSDHLNMSAWLKRATFGRLTAMMMRRAYRGRLMIGASKGLVDDSVRNFNAARGEVIPNGIDASIVRNKAAECPRLAPGFRGENPTASRGLNEKASYLVAVGRLTPQKDFATLVRAYGIARQQGLTEQLCIAGEGEERSRLEAIITELRIGGNVELLGHQPNPFPLIAGARCLVLSSIWEGFAYVPVEAMALGVPCVCTDCPSGPAEILGNGTYGILAEPGNPQSLARAMIEMCGNESTHAHFARQASVRAGQLSVENMTRAYRDIFRREAGK